MICAWLLIPVLLLAGLVPGRSDAQGMSTLCQFTAVTLYASSNDKARRLSKKFHGYQRAGDSTPAVVVSAGLDTVDASAVDTSLVGHSYCGDNRAVLSDLFYLLRNGAPPRFGLQLRVSPQGSYWTFWP